MPVSLEYARITPDARDFLREDQNINHLIGQKVPGMMHINERGQRIFSFKHPTSDELIHLPHNVVKMDIQKDQPEQYSPVFHDRLLERADIKRHLHGKVFQNDISAHQALQKLGAKYVPGSSRIDSNNRLRTVQYRHPQHGTFNVDISRFDGTAKVNHIGSQGQMDLMQMIKNMPVCKEHGKVDSCMIKKQDYDPDGGDYHPLHGKTFKSAGSAHQALQEIGAKLKNSHPFKGGGSLHTYSHPHGEFEINEGPAYSWISHTPSQNLAEKRSQQNLQDYYGGQGGRQRFDAEQMNKYRQMKMQKGGDPKEVAKWVNATHMKQPRQEQVADMEKTDDFRQANGDKFEPVCNQTSPDGKWGCTRPKHTSGPHIAHAGTHTDTNQEFRWSDMTKADESAPHAHHWVLPPPAGKMSTGTCKTCGETKDFPNYNPTGVWDNTKVPGRVFNRKTSKVEKAGVRNPFAVATAAAQKAGFSDFSEGSAGKEKRSEIAEAIKRGKMQISKMFPSWFNLVKSGKLDSKKYELDKYHLKAANLSSLRKAAPGTPPHPDLKWHPKLQRWVHPTAFDDLQHPLKHEDDIQQPHHTHKIFSGKGSAYVRVPGLIRTLNPTEGGEDLAAWVHDEPDLVRSVKHWNQGQQGWGSPYKVQRINTSSQQSGGVATAKMAKSVDPDKQDPKKDKTSWLQQDT